MYIGHRHKRVTGQQYDDFIDEFLEAVVRRYQIPSFYTKYIHIRNVNEHFCILRGRWRKN